MSALVDDASAALVEDVQLLASAAAGLIVSKRHYTDGYEFARRLEPMDLAAEFRWALLPPLTLWSPRCASPGCSSPRTRSRVTRSTTRSTAMSRTSPCSTRSGTECARAASRTSRSRRTGTARRRGADLTETAEAIDAILIDQFGESWFVTAMLGELDIARGPAAVRVGGPSAADAVARRQGRRADRGEAGTAAGVGRSGARR